MTQGLLELLDLAASLDRLETRGLEVTQERGVNQALLGHQASLGPKVLQDPEEKEAYQAPQEPKDHLDHEVK